MTEWRFSCTASPSPKEHGQEERSEFKAQATLGIKISFITSPTCFSLWVSSGSSRTAQISQPCFPQVNSPSYGGFVWLQTFPVCLSCRRSVAVTVCQKTAFTQILKTAYPEVINLNSSELLCAPSGTSLIRSHKQRKVKTLPGILPIHEQVAPFLRSAQPNTLSECRKTFPSFFPSCSWDRLRTLRCTYFLAHLWLCRAASVNFSWKVSAFLEIKKEPRDYATVLVPNICCWVFGSLV